MGLAETGRHLRWQLAAIAFLNSGKRAGSKKTPTSEYRLKSGEKEPMHSHPRGLVYYFADAKCRVSFPDGKSEESELKAGEAHWRDAVTHAAENIGNTEAHAIAVELKKPVR